MRVCIIVDGAVSVWKGRVRMWGGCVPGGMCVLDFILTVGLRQQKKMTEFPEGRKASLANLRFPNPQVKLIPAINRI